MARKKKVVESTEAKTPETPVVVTPRVDVMGGLNQTHGALTSPRNLDQLAGYKIPYDTKDVSVYLNMIRAMTDIDLHEHAYTVGLVPIDIRPLLESRLEKQFLESQSVHVFRTVPSTMTPEARKRQEDFMRNSR